MKAFLKIISLFFVPLIILATGGFGFYQHHCYKTGQSDFSVLFEQIRCDHHKNSLNHDAPCSASDACCSRGEAPETNDHQGNCCVTITEFFKTDIPQLKKPHLNFSSESFHLLPAFEESGNAVPEEAKGRPARAVDDIPPPVSGKEILIFLHQLRLSDPPGMA